MIEHALHRTLPLILVLLICSLPVHAEEPEFAVDVMAVLSKAGCNAGTCHGNLNGKGGFKLSLRGQDARHDYDALVRQDFGRRVNPLAPEESLVLLKATASVAHGGGKRFDADSYEYDVLASWALHGAKPPSQDAPTVERLEVTPKKAMLVEPVREVQLRVTAWMSDGSSRDVSSRACYETSNLLASVDAGGKVSSDALGETTVIVRYLQKQAAVPVAFIAARPDYAWSDPPVNNPIDRLVYDKLRQLRMNPSPLCDDLTFVRRTSLDLIGRAPTADEARFFAESSAPDKRERLVDRLLARPELADYWALKWCDILRVEEKVLDTKGVEAFHEWIRDGVARGRPLDEFVQALVTGLGSTYDHPPANYYRANRSPSVRGETTARLFLGARLQCAKCHNHPFDRWTQDDYYAWASVFSQIDYKQEENERKDKLDKNEFVGEQIVLAAKQDEVRNPTTGEVAKPKFLGGKALPGGSEVDRLVEAAEWLTSKQNDLFVKSQANFLWHHLLGRGLVEPIDDFRQTNPASNPPLLDWLASELARDEFDIRSLLRKVVGSRVYQHSSEPNETNATDKTAYSHAIVRRLPAEVLLDIQSDVLDEPAAFAGYERGIRAVQIPGVRKKRRRDQAPLPGDRFLKTFGKPERILACDCERSNETTLKQVFTLVGEGLNERLTSDGNRIHRLAESSKTSGEIVDQLYWTALSRPPNDAERAAATAMLDESGDDRAAALADIAWALLNAKELLFRR